MDLRNMGALSVSRHLQRRRPVLYTKKIQSGTFEKNGDVYDAICILAVQLLETIGVEEQFQWQIDEAEEIVRSMLRIIGREAKFFTSDEIKKKLVMACSVVFEKFAEYKFGLPQIKVVPCNNGSTLQSVDHPEHTDYDVTRCINGSTYV